MLNTIDLIFDSDLKLENLLVQQKDKEKFDKKGKKKRKKDINYEVSRMKLRHNEKLWLPKKVALPEPLHEDKLEFRKKYETWTTAQELERIKKDLIRVLGEEDEENVVDVNDNRQQMDQLC
jgi:Icc-related predicted phosphoesterase